MNSNITLSPSNLTFLWHSCKRCFYNHYVYKNRRPMTMPLVGKMATLSEDWFIEKKNTPKKYEKPEWFDELVNKKLTEKQIKDMKNRIYGYDQAVKEGRRDQ